MVRRSKVHFVHCLLPKAEAVGGAELRVAHGESLDSGLMTLDLHLLRAQLRGSKLLDALRIYRQGEEGIVDAFVNTSGCVQDRKKCPFWPKFTNVLFKKSLCGLFSFI